MSDRSAALDVRVDNHHTWTLDSIYTGSAGIRSLHVHVHTVRGIVTLHSERERGSSPVTSSIHMYMHAGVYMAVRIRVWAES